MGKRFVKTAVSVLAVLAAAGAVGHAYASGFQLFEQSPSGQGNAFAGAAAVAEDASTIFFNPAGMTHLNGNQVVGGIHLVVPEATFRPTSAKTSSGASLTGDPNPDGGGPSPVPNLYVMGSITDDLKAGVGVESPFGLSTDYGKNWIGRYYAIESSLQTINFNPSLAYRVTDWASVGAGLDVLYADARLTNAIDFGSVCTTSAASAFCPLFGLSPQANDGTAKVQSNDLALGWNVGAMFKPLEHTRVGVAYRSKYVLEFAGQANFAVPAAFRTFQTAIGNTAFQSGSARTKITLPETASIAVYQQIDPKWAVFGDVTWTRWSRFQALVISFDNPAQAQSITQENWHNTFREALGLSYAPNEKSKLRLGVAYDPTPVRTTFRTVRIPDDDRFWLSAGYHLDVTKDLSLDAAYTHIFVLGNGEVDLSSPIAGNINGTFDSQVNIFTIGLKYQF